MKSSQPKRIRCFSPHFEYHYRLCNTHGVQKLLFKNPLNILEQPQIQFPSDPIAKACRCTLLCDWKHKYKVSYFAKSRCFLCLHILGALWTSPKLRMIIYLKMIYYAISIYIKRLNKFFIYPPALSFVFQFFISWPILTSIQNSLAGPTISSRGCKHIYILNERYIFLNLRFLFLIRSAMSKKRSQARSMMK